MNPKGWQSQSTGHLGHMAHPRECRLVLLGLLGPQTPPLNQVSRALFLQEALHVPTPIRTEAVTSSRQGLAFPAPSTRQRK